MLAAIYSGIAREKNLNKVGPAPAQANLPSPIDKRSPFSMTLNNPVASILESVQNTPSPHSQVYSSVSNSEDQKADGREIKSQDVEEGYSPPFKLNHKARDS